MTAPALPIQEPALPPRMVKKIELAPCRVSGLEGDCWNWVGAIQSKGYGSVGYRGRVWSTHKLTYTLLVGPVPDGLEIDHLCRNRRCCNPLHLEPVTRKVNAERSGPATKTHCVHGHELSGDNLLIKKRGKRTPVRNCRTCRDNRAIERRAARGDDVLIVGVAGGSNRCEDIDSRGSDFESHPLGSTAQLALVSAP